MTKRTFDIFISYASEDAAVAEELSGALQALGLRVWLDRLVLKVGSSLRRSIDEGLANCTYGVVILSPSFLVKSWPQRELDGLVSREIGEGRSVILPIWHEIGPDDIRRYSPPLADKLALRTSLGILNIAGEIASVVFPVSADQKRLVDISSERGFWYRRIDFSAQVFEANARWQLRWDVAIVSETDGLEGIAISYKIDDLLQGSLEDRVLNNDIQLEKAVASHPRAVKRFFRFPMPMERGEERTISYVREFRKTPPHKPSDLFVSKVAIRCDLMILRVSFAQPPSQLFFRIADRGESHIVADEILSPVLDTSSVQRVISPTDRALTYGFFWTYSDES